MGYYLSYSTGNTHLIVYATSDNPYGPFVYQGIINNPVDGWTNHHSTLKLVINGICFIMTPGNFWKDHFEM